MFILEQNTPKKGKIGFKKPSNFKKETDKLQFFAKTEKNCGIWL